MYKACAILRSRAGYLHAGWTVVTLIMALSMAGSASALEGLVLTDDRINDNAGRLIVSGGDVNGDGVDDFAVLADRETFIIFGQTGLAPGEFDLPSLLPENGGDGTRGFVVPGTQASLVEDVNGDGIDDVLTGDSVADPNDVNSGQALIIFGRERFPAQITLAELLPENGGDGSQGVVVNGAARANQLGFEVRGIGDVNGDGLGDMAFSAVNAGESDRLKGGKVYVLFGRATPFPAVIEVAALDPANGGDGQQGVVVDGIDGDGGGLSRLGGPADLNQDGLDDVILGAPNRVGSRGEVYVIYGREEGFGAQVEVRDLFPFNGGDGTEGFVLVGSNRESAGGRLAVGDINGDGATDLLVDAQELDTNGQLSGGIYVVFGPTTGFPAQLALQDLRPEFGGDGSAGFVLEGEERSYTTVGRGVGRDLNGDGIDDVLARSELASPDNRDSAGEAAVLFGTASPLAPVIQLSDLKPENGGDGSRGFVVIGADRFDQLSSMTSADVNADGIDDLLIGAQGADPEGRSGAGESYVLFGTTQTPSPQTDLRDLVGVDGFTASLQGPDLRVAICRNLTTGQSVRLELPEVTDSVTADCEGAGLVVEAQDALSVVLVAVALSDRVFGNVNRIASGPLVSCLNVTTGETNRITLAPDGDFDCGISRAPSPGDVLVITLAGPAF